MQPRLATSVKWTPFPEEFSQKVLQVFSENFAQQTTQGEFLIDGRIYPQEILIRIGYVLKGQLRQINFEASVEYSMTKAGEGSQEQTAFQSIYKGVDALGSLFEEYFAETDEEMDMPIHWQAYDFEDGIVWLQSSTVNTRLEAEADQWLKNADEKVLVHDDAQDKEGADEDALSRAIVDTELALDVQAEIRKGPKIQ
ncbi:MAG: hypothetical protein NDI61_07505 [Bdellovibrionaceae bacterium]|nr:hypothetical protein [Pseudobdellovibrionaceae bacterium]